MALFGNKTEEKKKTQKEETSSASDVQKNLPKGKRILLAPYVTEKSALLSDLNVYTFEIADDANKKEVARAVEDVYGVKPVNVRTVRLPGKKVMRRGGAGIKRRPKKAYVELKKGDSIELF